MSRIVITSLGPAEKLGAAAIPIRAQGASSYASRGMINGSPGVVAVPAPVQGIPQDTTPLGIIGGYHRSSQVAAVWYPGVYYQDNTTDPPEHAPVSVLSDNQMPIPAINPLGPAAVMMGRPRLGGQFQVSRIAALPSYPNMGSSG
jgi:hypothetical protein